MKYKHILGFKERFGSCQTGSMWLHYPIIKIIHAPVFDDHCILKNLVYFDVVQNCRLTNINSMKMYCQFSCEVYS
jgi:hypothetical protein